MKTIVVLESGDIVELFSAGLTAKNPKRISTHKAQHDKLMELVQSRGGLAANLAHQPREVIEHIRD